MFVPGVVAGLLLTLPLVILELSNGRQGPAPLVDFPIPLFIVLWALAMAAVNLLAPFLSASRRAHLLTRPSGVVLRIAGAVVASTVWLLIVQDQWPCFMGVPYCD